MYLKLSKLNCNLSLKNKLLFFNKKLSLKKKKWNKIKIIIPVLKKKLKSLRTNLSSLPQQPKYLNKDKKKLKQ